MKLFMKKSLSSYSSTVRKNVFCCSVSSPTTRIFFVARLAKVATDLRLEDWDDTAHSRFTRNISCYKDTAGQYHSKAE